MSHYKPREDAIWHNGRRYVPTIYGQGESDTVHIANWKEFQAVGGMRHFNEDQTEIVLTLPPGHKFSFRFQE